VTENDVADMRAFISDHPELSRWKLSRALAERWSWHNAAGELKDMSCRLLLDRLDQQGLIQLPPRRSPPVSRMRRRRVAVAHATDPIACQLRELGDIALKIVLPRSPDEPRILHLLERYHYLGYTFTIGENIRYIIRDGKGRILAVAVWGSPALQITLRDQWIGWDRAARKSRLSMVVNNARFLIMPWVQVPHLASHLLGRMARRISADWQQRYGHPVHLAETFVQSDLYPGTCYRAANWVALGMTTGRSRRGQSTTALVPPKLMFVLPLIDPLRMRRILVGNAAP
jgi:hypothetical protein